MELSQEEIEVLAHTKRNQRYCGISSTVRALVGKGLMRSLGRVSWCPDEYFALTDAGRAALAGIRSAVRG